MKRIYYLDGEKTSKEAIMEHLEDLLENNGNSEMWGDLGVNFEDVDYNFEVIYNLSPYEDDIEEYFKTREEAESFFNKKKDAWLRELANGDYWTIKNQFRTYLLLQNKEGDYVKLELREID